MAQGDEIPKKKYYVVMTDKFMSGWGMAEGMTNKFIIGCDDLERAGYLFEAARRRPEMKYVNFTVKKPRYGNNILVSYRDEKQISW